MSGPLRLAPAVAAPATVAAAELAPGRRRPPLGVAVLLLALALIGRVPDLFYNFRDWDEAAMMAQGWATTRGEVLYRDVFQIHPPLNMLYFVPFFELLPPAEVPLAVKSANLLLVALVGLLLFEVAHRRTGQRAPAIVAAASFAFMTSGRFDWTQSTHGEFLTIAPLLASALLLFSGDLNRRRSFAAGALWATAVFIKQVALVDCVALAALFALDPDRSRRRIARPAAWILLGAAAVTGALVSWLVVQEAAVPAAQQLLGTIYHHYLDEAGIIWRTVSLEALAGYLPWHCAAAILGALVLRSRRTGSGDRELYLAAALWCAVVLVALCGAGRFYSHYLLQVLAPLALAASSLVAALPRRWRALTAGGIVAALGVSMGIASARQLRALAAEGWRPYEVRQSLAVAEAVRRLTGSDERIFLHGVRNLDVFFLAERLSANGVYLYIDMALEHMGDPAFTRRAQNALLADPPRAILLARVGVADYPSSKRFIDSLLKARYQRQETVEGIRIFLLRSAAP